MDDGRKFDNISTAILTWAYLLFIDVQVLHKVNDILWELEKILYEFCGNTFDKLFAFLILYLVAQTLNFELQCAAIFTLTE